MAMMRSANPTLTPNTFTGVRDIGAEPMTLQGTVNKTGVLLLCLFAAAAWTWSRAGAGEEVGPWLLTGALGGFVTALVTVFKKNWSPVTAPVYALLEGLVIGGLSAMLDQQFHGIAMQAAGLTFGILFSLFVVGVAAMNLVLDFDLIESASRRGAPKYMEWYGAFALMVTLIWLYIEMLRLLSKMRSRRYGKGRYVAVG